MIKKLSYQLSIGAAAILLVVAVGCTNKEGVTTQKAIDSQAIPPQNFSKGVGPIREVKLEPVDKALAAKGLQIFKAKCESCHSMTGRLIGPPIQDITKRRSPEWILNMILNPTEMTKKDPSAKELKGKFLTQMENLNLSQEDARLILEYFRKNDSI